MRRDDQVRRLTADVELLQAQVAGMTATITDLSTELAELTALMVPFAEHVNTLAVGLALERNRADG